MIRSVGYTQQINKIGMLGDLFALEESFEETGDARAGGTAFNKMKKPPMQRASTNFVGLENQGATCYLNSLIQSMYMTPELRKGMFDIDPLELGIDLLEVHEQEAAEDTQKGIIEPDESNLSLLMSMGIAEHHARRALIGTKNGSLDDVFEYIEKHENDAEFNKPMPTNSETEENGKKKRKKPRFIPIELQRLFAQLQLIDQQAVSTHELTMKGFEWQNMDGQVQHDAHELNRLLIDALEKSLKRTSGETLCKRLYEGSCVNQIKCLTCLGASERTEPYYDINLQIVDCPDVCVSLRRHCAAELLTGDSAYQCDTCRVKRQALRSTVLRTIPQVLTFSCSRFRIDRSTNWTRVKVTSRSEFPLILDMAPFSEAGNAQHNGNGTTGNAPHVSVYDPLFENPTVESDYLESLRQSKNIIWLQNLLRAAEGVAKELLEQYGEAVCFDDVDDEQYEAIARHLTPHMFGDDHGRGEKMLYQLHAVIMHRGSAHSGHYFAYIRDNLSEGKWELPELDELLRRAKETAPDGGTALEPTAPDAGESFAEAPAPVSQIASSQSGGRSTNTKLDAKHKHRAGPASASSAKQPLPKVAPQKAYVHDKESGMYLVEEASPLSLIVKVMRASNTAALGTSKDAHHRFANKPGKPPQQGKPLPNARFKVNYIGTEVGNIVKSSWANAFKIKFGTLEAFMRAQTDLLKVFDNGEVFLLTNNIQVLPPTAYQQKVAKLAPPLVKNSGTRAPGGVPSGQLNNMNDVDAQLARQLQAELDFERHHDDAHSTPTAGGSTPAESWETAGTKRRDKKINIDGARAGSGVAGAPTKPSSKGSSNDTLSPHEARVKILSAEIVSHFYGNYFEFNDSSVVPISAAHLQRAFEGGDSAYLLVYRTVAVPADAQKFLNVSRGRLRSETQKAASPVECITPPAHFVKEVAALNDQLQKERTKYELSFSNLQLTVHFPAQFIYNSPLLIPKSEERGEQLEKPTDGEQKSALLQPSVLEIDSRQCVLDLKIRLAQDQPDLAARLGVPTLPSRVPTEETGESSSIVDLSGWVLSRFRSFGEGFYVMETFEDKTSIADVVSSVSGATASRCGTHVLLWDGKTIAGEKVLTGMQGYPKQLSVSMLQPGSAEEILGDASRHSKVVPVQESKLFPSLYLASTLSLLEFAHKLCDVCSVDPLRAVISVLCVSSISGKERTYAATTLYNKGIVSGKALVGVAPNVSTTSSTTAGMVMTSSSALGEFENLYYVLVEDCESRGLHTSSLTEAFVARKNAEWSITVEPDFPPASEETEKVGDLLNMDKFDAFAMARVQIDIPKYYTVEELRLAALKHLQLSGSYEASTRLRLGVNRGEQVLSDESCDLVTGGLRNGTVLYLEQGARPAADSLVLNIVLVNHNSTDVKYCLDEGGERLTEVEITAQWCDTIESLRERAGELLLNYQPGWTSRCCCLTQGTGLQNHLGAELSAPSTTEEVPVDTGTSSAGTVLDAEAPSEETLVNPKELAVAEFGLAFQGRRLRRTSWLKEPTELLLETCEEMVTQRIVAPLKGSTGGKNGKKGPVSAPPVGQKADSGAPATVSTLVVTPMTVKDSGLKSGETLLLEEGILPVKGQMNIQLYVWRPKGSNIAPSDTCDATMLDTQLSILEEADSIRKACLVPLGSVVVNERDQLDDLHERAHTLLTLQTEYLNCTIADWTGDIALDRFLLRELRADLLPGRSFWTSEIAVPTPVPSTLANAGSSQAGANSTKSASIGGSTVSQKIATAITTPPTGAAATAETRPVRLVNPNNTLKRLGLRGERGLVIELLKDSQSKVRPPVGAFRVWVQELLNPGAKEGSALVSPRWPPLQVLINGGVAPTLGHLKRAVVSALPDIATEHMSVYKYQPQGIEWNAVIAAGVGVNTTGRKKGGKTESNITQGPYFIKEGDQLCAFDSRSVRLAPGCTADADGVIRFALAEELQLRVMREAERAERKLKKQYKSGVSFVDDGVKLPRIARKEVTLSLGSGFDFSDDES